MSVVFPKFDELYLTIANDCYPLCAEIVKEKDKALIDLLNLDKNQLDDFDKLYMVKSYISTKKTYDKKYAVIATFASNYIYSIFEFFRNKDIENSEVRFAYEFCLAYIALVGFKSMFTNTFKDEDLFKFQPNKFKYYSQILTKYSIIDQITNFYEGVSNQILAEKNNSNKYFNLILRFDEAHSFYPEETVPTKEEPSNSGKKSAKKNQ